MEQPDIDTETLNKIDQVFKTVDTDISVPDMFAFCISLGTKTNLTKEEFLSIVNDGGKDTGDEGHKNPNVVRPTSPFAIPQSQFKTIESNLKAKFSLEQTEALIQILQHFTNGKTQAEIRKGAVSLQNCFSFYTNKLL